jgi:hypothetical protein
MEHHNTGLTRRTSRSEPSWPTVIATTVRLWLQRHPVAGRKAGRGRRSVLVAALVVVIAAGVVVVVIGLPGASSTASRTSVSRETSAGSTTSGALGASIATRAQAAKWVAQQIASSAIVACDPAMCAALQADGLPAARLLVLGTAAADPLGSDVVVATPALRNQFGARLASVYAPAVIASFGSGAAQIDVRAIAPSGAAAYESALAADQRARIGAGRQLLGNSHLEVSSSARAALRSGDVDSRLLITLAALAAQQHFRILSFDASSPGAASAPLRGAELAPARAGAQAKAHLQSMLSFVDAQQAPFLPLYASVHDADLSFEYSAPSTLGELGTP